MTRPRSVLIVDDEEPLVRLITYALEKTGLEVFSAATGRATMEAVRLNSIDLILLDVLLPDISGHDLCRKLRRHTQAPIIFLTAKSDQEDVIAGLEAGGDDYLAKPFSIEELKLRIRGMLRRTVPQERAMRFGKLLLELENHDAFIGEHRLDLSPLEFRFLQFLAVNNDRVLSINELIDEVWGVAEIGANDPLVKTAVYRLRQKLGDPYDVGVEIRNVRSVGYQLRVIDMFEGSADPSLN